MACCSSGGVLGGSDGDGGRVAGKVNLLQSYRMLPIKLGRKNDLQPKLMG